jgi:hypothetical protein
LDHSFHLRNTKIFGRSKKAFIFVKKDLKMEIKTDLFLGDCKDLLKKIPDNSVDL